MIGIGKWEFDVNNMFFKGKAVLEIIDKNGDYDFKAIIPGLEKIPSYFINDLREDGNTLTITGGSDLMPGKEIQVVATFENNKCNGYIKVPLIGKIMIKDGIKIA